MEKKQGDTPYEHQPGVPNTLRMPTFISPSQLAAVISCFSLLMSLLSMV